MEQVQRLSRALVAKRQQIDASQRVARMERRLLGLNRRITRSQSLQYIYAQLPLFACRELGYQCSVLFVDDRKTGVLTARANDGYDDDAQRRQVSACQIEAGGALYGLVRNSVMPVHLVRSRDPQLRSLVNALGLDRFLVAPLRSPRDEILGVLIAGNRADAPEAYTRVGMPSQGADGFVGAAELAANAITHCTLYWELAVERNLLEAKISERTAELGQAYERMREEAKQAQQFQRSIFADPPNIPGFAVDICYRPADMVGGDVYDVGVRPDGSIQLFVADATGHGVGASLTTMFIKGEYEQHRHAADPAALLAAMNDDIARLYGRLEMRFTAAVLIIDPARRTMTYSTAGHPPPCVLKGGDMVELESDGAFMGLVRGVEFPQWTEAFEPGDGLFAFTDGAFEEWEGDVPFGEERLYRAIREAVQQGRPIGEAVCERIRSFVSGRAFADDVTLVGVRWLR
jgi:sigma-B regulation protein RsbU (phosphoserine phosphatase)